MVVSEKTLIRMHTKRIKNKATRLFGVSDPYMSDDLELYIKFFIFYMEMDDYNPLDYSKRENTYEQIICANKKCEIFLAVRRRFDLSPVEFFEKLKESGLRKAN